MIPSGRSLHIGILCDYGFTLLPKSGIGVFVYNLIDGLRSLTPRPKITVLANPTDQDELQEWAERWGQDVRILPSMEESRKARARLGRLLKRWHERLFRIEDDLCIWWDRFAPPLKKRGSNRVKEAWSRYRSSPKPSKTLLFSYLSQAILWLALLGIGSWIGEIFSSLLLVFLLPSLAFPVRLAHRAYQKAVGAPSLETRLAAADCDVWLVPFPGTEVFIVAPHVLVIFDLVFRHVPEIYSASERDHFERVFAARAREATIIYCGSNFVKEHDLLPCYPFAADRIRVFRLAPPRDLQPDSMLPALSHLCRKYKIGNRFLFYPAALRAHKNHATLVRALRLLRQEYGHSDLELVFTGEGRQNPELVHLVEEENLRRHVHFLGLISRQEIQAFYRHALLVPLPSLHEGYGLPLLEALQNECPVACADIPAFRELLDESSEGVLFFDAHDPASMAQVISLTMTRRDEFRDRQRQAFQRIARRDWHAVAKDFLGIFEEACHLAVGNRGGETIHHAA